MDIFSNILIYFVVVPVLMLVALGLCRDIKQIRAVAVAGSTVLIALSVWLLVDYLNKRAGGNTDPMLFTGSWAW
ncbi:MAG: NADH-quinone oxidoreductase subunit M, partial [Muribaculaceae bacterium]|nr:NADH-quinone oxidoreductase subunit M [Muribaculaceae bacterium]